MEFADTFAAWMALGVLSLAPVGAVLGAVAGAVARARGQAPGCALGKAVARKFADLGRKELSPVTVGAIVGAVDGAVFLGVVGIPIGLLAGAASRLWILLLVGAAAAALALLAILFGVFAHGLIHFRTRGVALFFFTGIGALLGLSLNGASGAGWGLLAGGVLGLLSLALHGKEE